MTQYFLSREFTPQIFDTWGIQSLHDSGNWGEGVGVCVIDSAILSTNPDLSNVISLNFANGTSTTRTHGQYVMSLLSAPVNNWGSVGICPASTLILANVDSADNNMYTSSIVAALNFARLDARVDIISVSLGTTTNDPSLLAAINSCYSAGKLIFAAAGNQSGYGIIYPAYYPGVISVASSSSSGSPSAFNTKNDAVAIFAPGEGISFVKNGDSSGTILVQESGTSYSCPFAAGAASLLLCKHRKTNPGSKYDRAQIVQLLRNTFKLTCTLHTYARTDNPCVSSALYDDALPSTILMQPQNSESNSFTTEKMVIGILSLAVISLIAILFFSSTGSIVVKSSSK